MKFKHTNPNPNKNQGGLCSIRAICTGMEKTWEEVYPEYVILADNKCSPINDINVFNTYLYRNDWRIDDSIEEGKTTVEEYSKINKGYCVLDLGDHASALLDDTILDTYNCGKDLIYTAWKKEE